MTQPTDRRFFLKQLLTAGAGAAVMGNEAADAAGTARDYSKWRAQDNLQMRMTDMSGFIIDTLKNELETAKKSGKIPVVLVGEAHNNKTGFYAEMMIGLALADLLK